MTNEYTLFETGSGKWLHLKGREIQFRSGKEDATIFDSPLEILIERYKLGYIEHTLEKHIPEWVLFNPTRSLGQNQYASRAIDGRHGYPNLGEGLRFQGDPCDYHMVRIHRDDYEEFHRRYHEYQKKRDLDCE